jgi:hypothetical protein
MITKMALLPVKSQLATRKLKKPWLDCRLPTLTSLKASSRMEICAKEEF